jgi:hypothetical protein
MRDDTVTKRRAERTMDNEGVNGGNERIRREVYKGDEDARRSMGKGGQTVAEREKKKERERERVKETSTLRKPICAFISGRLN